MCVKLKSSGMKPGQINMFTTSKGNGFGQWGFQNGKQYNVRLESLPTIWNKPEYKRSIISVDSFWEKNKQFEYVGKRDLHIGVIYNPEAEWAVITCPANEIVAPFHHRMPLVLDYDNVLDFMDNKDPIIMPVHQMKLVA